MRDLLTKKLKSDGFTLAELLIVVAIIAVLAVIAIPIFALKVESSKEETDIANLRAAKSAATAQFLLGEDLNEPALTITAEGFECYFDAAGGVLKSSSDGIEPYGQGTESAGSCEDFAMVTNPDEDHPQTYYTDESRVAGGIIKIYINGSGTVALSWVDSAGNEIDLSSDSSKTSSGGDTSETNPVSVTQKTSVKVMFANELALVYDCSITENEYQTMMGSAVSGDTVVLEATVNGSKSYVVGSDKGTYTKKDEATGKDMLMHKWSFVYNQFDPSWMAEDITVNMYLGRYNEANKGYEMVVNKMIDNHVYSVAEYCNDAYRDIVSGKSPYSNYSGASTEMKNLLADLLMYGEKCQIFHRVNMSKLCTTIDYAYTYSTDGEITSRNIITTKEDVSITSFNVGNSYWDLDANEALSGKNNAIFDSKASTDRWSWIDEYRTTSDSATAAEKIPETKTYYYGTNSNTTDVVDPDTNNYSIKSNSINFGAGGYVFPTYYCEIKGDNLSNYRLAVQLYDENNKTALTDASGNPIRGIYYFNESDKSNGQYYIMLGKDGDTSFQFKPQDYGKYMRVMLQVKTTAGKWRTMKQLSYSVNCYCYNWTSETYTNSRYIQMQDLAYALYRYGISTKNLYNIVG